MALEIALIEPVAKSWRWERPLPYSLGSTLAFIFRGEISLSITKTTGKALKRQRTNLSQYRFTK